MARRSGRKGWHISRPKARSRKYNRRSNQWQYPKIRRSAGGLGGKYRSPRIRKAGVQFTYRNRRRA